MKTFADPRKAAEFIISEFDGGEDEVTIRLGGFDSSRVSEAVAKLRPGMHRPSISGRPGSPRTFIRPLNW